MRGLFQRCALIAAVCAALAACAPGGQAATVTPPPTRTPPSTGGLAARPTATAQAPDSPTDAPPDTPPTEPAPTEAPVEPTEAPPASFARTLQVESPRLEGADVLAAQERLLGLGYAQVGAADGVFGPQTSAAVKRFQAINGLPADGVVEALTWDTLFGEGALADQAPAPSTGRIIFVKPDGVTLASVKPDGSDEQIFYETGLEGADEVSSLSLDPSGTFLAYTYGEGPGLVILKLDGTVVAGYEGLTAPIWSADGSFFLSNFLSPSGDPKMVMYVTDNSDGAGPVSEFPALQAAWFPDGKQIAYTDGSNISIYYTDDGSSSQLTEFPAEGDGAWYVQHVAVSPDGSLIFFYGGQSINLGASGNGMQWWLLPSAGGSAGCSQSPTGCGEPIPFREPGGNGIGEFAYNPGATLMAYTEGFHVSACVLAEGIVAIEPGASEGGFAPAIIDAPPDGGMYVRGLAWSPDGGQLAYGVVAYACDESGQENLSTTLYVWELADSIGAPIAEGSFPVWLTE